MPDRSLLGILAAMTATPEEQVRQWAGMFDSLSSRYDQTGVPFFRTIARGLVEHLDPQPGERAADLGFGRGAATFLLADAVGPDGRVDGIDIAPGMVELTSAEARGRGLDQVHLSAGDATDPALEAGAYDLVAASLVVFFLPEPDVSLPRWLGILRPGGRLGATTFRPWQGTWKALEELFAEYVEDTGRPTTTAMPEAFQSDEGVEGLFRDAGVRDVRTEGATYDVPFASAQQWREWSLGTNMRGLWMRTPEAAHDEIMERATALLEHDRGPDGRIRLQVSVRYTLGVR